MLTYLWDQLTKKQMLSLFLFFLLSIAFSFLCSILEAVLLSITPNYINAELRKGSSTGLALQEYKEDIDRPLSAILTLNTIAHTVGAIGVGSMAASIWNDKNIEIGSFALSYETIVAVVMTLAILILSEIIPKTIGANNWKGLAPFTVSTLKALLFILAPLVWVSQLITKGLKSDKEKSVLSRSDILAMTLEGSESGALKANEGTIINNLLSFEKMTVRDIMSPKTVGFMADEKQSLQDFYSNNKSIPFSRIPVYDGQSDNITGIVLKDHILEALAEDRMDTLISDIKKPVNFISDSTPLPDLFNSLTKQKQHLSVVNDEFGNIVGLVSMEDLFETLLGQEIVDETDQVEDLQALAKDKWADKQNKK